MSPDGLTALQRRVVILLAGMQPPWTLTGGAALIGVHGVRRITRDIDLFFHGLEHLERVPDDVARRLKASGLDVVSLQTADAFQRFRVSDSSEAVLLDLVADPLDVVESPMSQEWEGARFLVDTPHEILVNKLCALIHRSELRDLSDVSDLVAAGGDFDRAMRDVPRKEAGFSPLTLAWLLRELPIEPMAEVGGLSPEASQRLSAFRDELVARVTGLSRPAS